MFIRHLDRNEKGAARRRTSKLPFPSPAVLPPIGSHGERMPGGRPESRKPPEGTGNAKAGQHTYKNEKGTSEVFLTEDRIELEMYRKDDREYSFDNKGASSSRYMVSAPPSARTPWTKRPAFISAVVFACLAVAGMVVGALVATDVIDTGGSLSSRTGNIPVDIKSTSQPPTTQRTSQRPTTLGPGTTQSRTTQGTSQLPATPGISQQPPTTPGTSITAQPTTTQPRTTPKVETTAALTTAGNGSIDGSWTTWTAWQACDVTCGGGVQRRTRACTNPPPADGGLDCAGRDEQARPCGDWECPGQYLIVYDDNDDVDKFDDVHDVNDDDDEDDVDDDHNDDDDDDYDSVDDDAL
ncbi:hypothetical protein Bbelb_236710 [Branchiostoma belcheri]|nr:hypothetical protein Bbelb_236710 [Branchiostoma belcheri]